MASNHKSVWEESFSAKYRLLNLFLLGLRVLRIFKMIIHKESYLKGLINILIHSLFRFSLMVVKSNNWPYEFFFYFFLANLLHQLKPLSKTIPELYKYSNAWASI